MKYKLFSSFTLLTLALFYSAFGYCQESEKLALNSPVRDPFSPPSVTAYCQFDDSETLGPLKEWRLLGVIGQNERRRGWVTNKYNQWLTLKQGDRLPDLSLTVSAITKNAAEFRLVSSSQNHCASPLTLKLNFQEQ